MSGATSFTTMTPVINNGMCIGFILKRGRDGHEAYSADQVSLGTFADKHAAVSAVSERRPQ